MVTRKPYQYGAAVSRVGRLCVRDAACQIRMHSVARPEYHLKRSPTPRPAIPAVQPQLERHQPRITGPALQQLCMRDDGLVRAGVTAGAHKVKDAQVLKPKSVTRR